MIGCKNRYNDPGTGQTAGPCEWEGDETMIVDENTLISDLLKADPTVEQIFLNQGMHCLHCVAASGETLGQACDVHDIDVDDFAEELSSYINR